MWNGSGCQFLHWSWLNDHSQNIVPQYVSTFIYFRPTLCFILVYNCGLTVHNKCICMLLICSNLQDWRHEETVLLFLSVFNMSASINCLKIMTTLDDANKQHYITLCSNNASSKLLTVLLSCLCYIMLHNMRTTLNMHVNLVKDWFTALTSIKNFNSHYAGQPVMASIYRNK